MQFNEKQTQVINSNSNTLVLGAPGTGKTLLIAAKVKKVISEGCSPESISFVSFSPKSANIFKVVMLKSLGNDAKRIKYATFKDFAEIELNAAGALTGRFADNTQMRRLLHQAKTAVNFKGSLHEAEHIIRNFKSQAKKPNVEDDNYDIFSKYQDLLHNRNWYDRYDCLRQHLIALRNDVAQPFRAKYIFVDNAQDMNQIQLLWLLEHSLAGVKVFLFMDDDQCIYQRSGALGGKVIDIVLESEVKFEKIELSQSYRLTDRVRDCAYKVVSLADQRFSRSSDLTVTTKEGVVEIKGFNSKLQEMDSLVSNIRHYFKNNPNSKLAVITRGDDDARYVSNRFVKEGFPFSDFSRSIWEMPGAIVVIDLLELLLGTATNAMLRNVLSTYGLNSKTIEGIFSKGLDAKGWLQNGAKVDKSLIQDENELKKLTKVQTMLVSYYRLRANVMIKDIFKALCFELMKNLSPEDKRDVLSAVEVVSSFKGKIQDNINLIRAEKDFNLNSQLVVGPAREFRGMEFDAVFIPFCTSDAYPYDYKVLGKKNSSDRRIFFTAMTRSKEYVYITYSGNQSSYIKALLAL